MRILLLVLLVVSCSHRDSEGPAAQQAGILVGSQSPLFEISSGLDVEDSEFSEYLEAGDWASVAKQAQQILAEKPFDLDALSSMAFAKFNQKNHAAASFYADLILSQDPTSALALNIKGIQLAEEAVLQADLIAARKLFEKAFASSSDELAAGVNLGYLHQEMGAWRQSIQVFEEVGVRCDSCPESQIGQAIAYRHLGEYERSADILEDVLANRPGHRKALYQMGLVRLKTNDVDQADSMFKQLLTALAPEEHEARQVIRQMITNP